MVLRVTVTLVLLLAVSSFGQSAPEIVLNPRSQLRTLEVGSGHHALVLLQGYASATRQWRPFTGAIHAPLDTRFVFPEPPEVTIPPDGPIGGRAWWRIHLASYPRNGEKLPDLSQANPTGLLMSSQRIRVLLEELQGRSNSPTAAPILGGFSQGAIVSADVAFASDQPLTALVLLSGTSVNEEQWIKGMANRRGLPVFIAHGLDDAVLGFAMAQRLQAVMTRAGLHVRWVPFAGGHEIPASVIAELNNFLNAL